MTEQRKKRKDLADEIEIDKKNLGNLHQDGSKEKVSISTYRGKPKNITNDFNFLLNLYEWGSGDVSTEVNDPEVEKQLLSNLGVELEVQKNKETIGTYEDPTPIELTMYEEVLKFLKYKYDVKN
jgi:hypothetical protein